MAAGDNIAVASLPKASATGYIYVIENLLNGKMYVGQTKNPEQRKRYQFSRFTHSRFLRNAVRKYGVESFDFVLLETCESLEKLNEREIHWIAALKTLAPNGYNLTPGGEAPQFTIETRRLLSDLKKGDKNPMFGRSGIASPTSGRKHTQEAKDKISAAHRGKTISSDVREKMRVSHADMHLGKDNPFFGKKHSSESREKMSGAQKGKRRSLETREKMRRAALLRWENRKKFGWKTIGK